MANDPVYDRANDPLMQTMGFVRLIEENAETGHIVLEFEAKAAQCHSGNIVQGGFVTGWIDTAMAQSVMLKSNYTLNPLSLDIKVAFLRAANPGPVIAEGRVELLGRKTAFTEGLLRTPDGEIIAKGMSTLKLVRLSR